MTDPTDLLRDVERLVELPVQERDDARRRTLISRAYYAAFHHVRAIADYADVQQGADARTATGMHRRFLDWLKKQSDPRLNRYGALLLRLYDHRITADYRLGRPIQPGAELAAVSKARTILSTD